MGGGRSKESEEPHVLDEHRIGAHLGQLGDEAGRLRQLVVGEQRVHGGIDLGTVLMGIVAKLGNVGQTVASGSACPPLWRTYVDSIGPVVDGGHTRGQVLCRCQQLQFPHHSIFEMS